MAVASAESLHLEPLAGPAMGPVRLEVADGPATLGRSASCRIVLADPDGTVSRLHAELRPVSGGWLLSDLKSKHGSFVNGNRLRDGEPTPLRDGDRVRIGPWTFHVGPRRAGHETRFAVTADDRPSMGGAVRRVGTPVSGTDASARLGVLMRCASRLPQAQTEAEAALAVAESLLAGSGYPRAAVVRSMGSGEAVEVLASACLPKLVADQAFSRSLLDAAMQGQTASLSSDINNEIGSMSSLGVTRALCAPVMLDGEADAAIYLDSRRGEPAPSPADENAASAFVQAMAQLLALAMSGLHRQRLESDRQRQTAELNNAHEVQRIIMAPPSGELAFGATKIRYAMRSIPGRFVAGDLFDCFEAITPDGRDVACLLLGDVVGKGIAAGLVMANIQAHLSRSLRTCADPGLVSCEASRIVAHYGERLALAVEQGSLFLSAWIGVIDPKAGTLRFTDAGHGYAILHQHGQPPAVIRGTGGPPLGVDAAFVYAAEPAPVAPGARILLFSDGLIEQRSPKGEPFGVARTIESMSRTSSAEEAVADVVAALRAFTSADESQTFTDDVTVACAEIL
jgi:phosphoserine phosphatase RsbU/P